MRVIGPYNSKLPKNVGWMDNPEIMSIRERLSSSEIYNYSIKTGELLGKGIHLLIVDIDLKEKTFQLIS